MFCCHSSEARGNNENYSKGRFFGAFLSVKKGKIETTVRRGGKERDQWLSKKNIWVNFSPRRHEKNVRTNTAKYVNVCPEGRKITIYRKVGEAGEEKSVQRWWWSEKCRKIILHLPPRRGRTAVSRTFYFSRFSLPLCVPINLHDFARSSPFSLDNTCCCIFVDVEALKKKKQQRGERKRNNDNDDTTTRSRVEWEG